MSFPKTVLALRSLLGCVQRYLCLFYFVLHYRMSSLFYIILTGGSLFCTKLSDVFFILYYTILCLLYSVLYYPMSYLFCTILSDLFSLILHYPVHSVWFYIVFQSSTSTLHIYAALSDMSSLLYYTFRCLLFYVPIPTRCFVL